MTYTLTRRAFLGKWIAACAVVSVPAGIARAGSFRGGPHPTPRPGITGAKVPTAEQLAKKADLIPLFDAVRSAPDIIDGIRCNCGCAREPAYYSLLTCFEAPAMARECVICQGQARLATRLHKLGKTLDEIRLAVDAKYE